MASSPGGYDQETTRALRLWVVLSRCHAAVSRQASEDIATYGFTPTEFGVMEFLYHKGPQPMAKVGQSLLVTSGNVTHVVDKLTARNLVTRLPCPSDRRIIYADLTDTGRELMAEIFPGHARRIKEILSVLDEADQNKLHDLLKRLGHGVQGSQR